MIRIALNNIRLNLEKFRNLKPADADRKAALIAAILHQTGITLKPADIKFSGASAYLTVSPAAKSEIMIHREGILVAVESKLKKII